MLTVELDNLKVRLRDEEFNITTPASLSGALITRLNPEKRGTLSLTELSDVLKEECSFGTSFILSPDAAYQSYAFVEVPDLGAPAEISFNGTAAFSVSGGRAHRLDVSKHVIPGANALVINFPESKEARDVSFFDNVRFVAFERAHIADITAKSVFVSNSVSVDVTLEFVGNPTDVKAVATLVSPSGKIYYGGVINGHAIINVPDPLLWWPGNYGVHNLYKLSVNLYYDNEVIDSTALKIGLRSVFLDQREGVALTVNGSKLLAMGTEYVLDGFPNARILDQRREELLSVLESANMNFLRIVASGYYPDDNVLSLCDSHGIAVEVLLKSNKAESGDVAAFKRELKYNFKRFSRHPSVISVAFLDSQFNDVYECAISEVKSELSSPIIVRKIALGDTYPLAPSLPDMKTQKELFCADDMNLFSYGMSGKESEVKDALDMLSLAAGKYKYAFGQAELTYTSGILQAELAEEYARKMRIARDGIGSFVMGTLFDGSPTVSRTLLDSELRLKPILNSAARFFAPVCVFPVKSESQVVRFFLSNESKTEFSGNLSYAVRDNKNNVIYKNEIEVGADRFSAPVVHEDDLFEHVYGYERERYLEYSLVKDGAVIFSAVELFTSPKYFKFQDPELLTMITGGGTDFVLNYSALKFAKSVVFSFENTDAVFEDNSVDVTSPSHESVRFKTKEPTTADALMRELRITSVFDIGNPKCR